MVFRMSYEVFMKNYREMDLNDLALSITLMSKVLRDKILEIRVNTYPIKKEIIESMENLIDTLKKIDLADELFIIDNALNDKEYSKVVEYAKTHGKNIRFLSQTPLNNLINEYKKIRKHLRNMRKNIITYRIGLEDAVENGDVENIKYYSKQLRESIIEYNNLRNKYYEVKGGIVGI